MEINDDIYILVNAIKQHITELNGSIFATSDGSAPNFVGTFGWSLSLGNGQRLAKNKGPAHGHRTTSFRAEAYGVLSLLRFLYQAFPYTGFSASETFQGPHRLRKCNEKATRNGHVAILLRKCYRRL